MTEACGGVLGSGGRSDNGTATQGVPIRVIMISFESLVSPQLSKAMFIEMLRTALHPTPIVFLVQQGVVIQQQRQKRQKCRKNLPGLGITHDRQLTLEGPPGPLEEAGLSCDSYPTAHFSGINPYSPWTKR